MNIPDDRKYQKTHEWVTLDNGIATVGISDHAQDSLGDIVFIELPEKGKKLSRGDEITTIESVKAASPIYSPVSGTVEEVNGDLEESPEIINQDPYNTFIVKIKMDGELDESTLLDAAGYRKVVEEEED
jgi:glycine cleavage system H protein